MLQGLFRVCKIPVMYDVPTVIMSIQLLCPIKKGRRNSTLCW